jgi:hypothetical protein
MSDMADCEKPAVYVDFTCFVKVRKKEFTNSIIKCPGYEAAPDKSGLKPTARSEWRQFKGDLSPAAP